MQQNAAVKKREIWIKRAKSNQFVTKLHAIHLFFTVIKPDIHITSESLLYSFSVLLSEHIVSLTFLSAFDLQFFLQFPLYD
mmetsp:Transcript_44997/g.45418  ORF Transcript_44997/g.45418 Transcript_44997/m.45418 type:complete len:81 (-) Transcript_44997:845-1087(-)